MDKVKFAHAPQNSCGGGYKIPQYYQKGGCYRERIVSSLLNLERKEVNAY